MRKLFNKKVIVTAMALVLSLVVSVVVFADAAPFISGRASTTKLSVEWDNVLNEEFSGVGANNWTLDLSNESQTKKGMTQAHSDLNAKRVATVPASVVRILFMPHYVMFLDTPDKGESDWKNSNFNYESDLYKAFVQNCKMYQDAGVRIMFNWGGANPTEIYDWFAVDGAFDSYGGTRAAPDDLELYAENMALVIKHLREEEGLTNIDVLNYHNEINHNNFAVFGNKATIWTKWLEIAHKALKRHGLRDKMTVMGIDESVWNGFLGEWGLNSNGGIEMEYTYYKYLYDNAKDPVTGEKYYDYFSIHIYMRTWAYTRTIDTTYNEYKKTDTGLKQMVEDSAKWYPGMWITEWSQLKHTDERPDDTDATMFNKTNAFEVSRPGQASTHINGKMGASLQWGYYGGLIPNPIDNDQVYSANKDHPLYEILWACPTDVGNGGYDKVLNSFGEMGLMHRYIPTTNKVRNTVAKSVKTSTPSADYRITAVKSETTGTNARKDVTVMVETNDESGVKNFEVNIAPEYKNLKFKKYVFEYPAEFMNINEDNTLKEDSLYDANAVLNPGEEFSLTDGKIVDTAPDKHLMIIYTTLDEAQQVYFENATDVRQEIKQGESFTYSTIKTEGLDVADGVELENFEYSIKTGSEYAEISQDGVITVKDDAPVDEWLSVKVAAKGTGVKEKEAYAIALVKVVAK